MIRRPRQLLWILPALSIVAVVLGYASIIESQPQLELVSPRTNPVEPSRSAGNVISALGTVEPTDEQTEIGTIVPGVVESVRVAAGDRVRMGSLLFVIDTRLAREAVEVRKAEVAVAEGKLDQARVVASDFNDQFSRVANLSTGLSVSESTLARRRFAARAADSATAVAERSLIESQAHLHAAGTLLEVHSVRSPINGTVLQVDVRPGEYALPGSPKKFMILGQLDHLHARVQIDESEMGRFDRGMHAYASARSKPSQRYELRFLRVEPIVAPKKLLDGSASERTDTRTLNVIYEVDDTQATLYVGQQLDVYLEQVSLSADQTLPERKSP
jgi:HlyD family secretion protein